MYRNISFSAVLILAVSSTCASAKAGVIVTFQEIAGNVIATTSGSIELPPTAELNFSGDFLGGAPDRLYWLSGNTSRFDGGTFASTSLITPPTTGSGSSFGFGGPYIYFDESVPLGSVYSPLTTWTWDSADLASIGLGSLSQTPAVVYTSSTGGTVSFATTAVPEPASFLMVAGFGGLAMLRRRRTRSASDKLLLRLFHRERKKVSDSSCPKSAQRRTALAEVG